MVASSSASTFYIFIFYHPSFLWPKWPTITALVTITTGDRPLDHREMWILMQIDGLKWPIYFIFGKKLTLSRIPRVGIRSFVELACNFLVERGFLGGITSCYKLRAMIFPIIFPHYVSPLWIILQCAFFLFLLRSSFWSGHCSSSDSVLICGREQDLEFLFRSNTEYLKVGIQGWDGQRTGNWMHLWDSVHVMGSGLLVRWCFHP